MKRYIPVALACLLAGCNTTGPVSVADALKTGCGAISIADGYFQAASPALVATGKLTQADIAKEQAIFKTAENTCANPPTDIATAGTALIADAGGIYLMLAVK